MARCERFEYRTPEGEQVTGFICVRGGPPPRPRADCGGCGRNISLVDGRFVEHDEAGPRQPTQGSKRRCAGWGKTPTEAADLGHLTGSLF